MSDVLGVESPALASCIPEKDTQNSGNTLREDCIVSTVTLKLEEKALLA